MDITNIFSHSFTLSFFWGVGLTLSALGGTPSFTMLTDRHYSRTNTWNGCALFGRGEGTVFHTWRCPRFELTAAVHTAFHHARYARQRRVPMSYYAVDETTLSNETRTVYANFEQLRPAVEYGFEIDGECVANLDVRVLPFAVTNPTSKTGLHCVLVAYFSRIGEFVFAVYVNINDGNVSLDFNEAAMEGYLFIASESRYPYLTPQECKKQREVYMKYFRCETDKPKHRSEKENKAAKEGFHIEEAEEIKVEVPGL